MQIFMTGGTGFIGGHLVDSFLSDGHSVTVLTRRAKSSSRTGLVYFEGDPQNKGPWQEVVADHDAVVNLAGANLFRPWTEKNKELIRESRVKTTANIAQALSRKKNGTSVLISASAVGYYGDRNDEELDEHSQPGNDFLAGVAVDWEKEAEKSEAHGVRVVRCRFGVVFGPDGGALAKMMLPFKLGLGSPLGPGTQWFSWIHIDDLVRIISFLMDNETIRGPVNCTAPNPVTNRELTKALARALHRPAFLPAVPAIVLKAVLGENARMVLDSQRVLPKILRDQGFTFDFPELYPALQDIVDR